MSARPSGQAADLHDRIERTPGVCGGRSRIAGTRIPVWTIVRYQQDGATTEEILRSFPSLDKADVGAAAAYYAAHRKEIDADIADQADA